MRLISETPVDGLHKHVKDACAAFNSNYKRYGRIFEGAPVACAIRERSYANISSVYANLCQGFQMQSALQTCVSIVIMRIILHRRHCHHAAGAKQAAAAPVVNNNTLSRCTASSQISKAPPTSYMVRLASHRLRLCLTALNEKCGLATCSRLAGSH